MASRAVSEASYEDIEALWESVRPAVEGAASIEAVARTVTAAVFEAYEQSLVLARVFGTVDYGQLPEPARIAAKRASPGDLDAETSVLALLGTRGIEPEWNDRRTSAAHAAIPLGSEREVAEIPMISRMLDEIGFAPFAPARGISAFVTRGFANVNGIFYVANAAAARDERDRLIIPSQDFVARHGVQSVFGCGGSYLSRHMFIALVLFCRETVPRSQAAKFVPMVSWIKAATSRMASRGAIFD